MSHLELLRGKFQSSIEWRTLLCEIVCKANGKKSSKSSKLFTCVYFLAESVVKEGVIFTSVQPYIAFKYLHFRLKCLYLLYTKR